MEYVLRRRDQWSVGSGFSVLILVLLEYGLRVDHKTIKVQVHHRVLILVLLEYGLRAQQLLGMNTSSLVLILVLLEYGLREERKLIVCYFS